VWVLDRTGTDAVEDRPDFGFTEIPRETRLSGKKISR